METVILKNGAEEAKPLVQVTMMSLGNLAKTNPIALYELVMKCRDRTHRFFGNAAKVLQDLHLVGTDGETIHDSIRNIVVSAAKGDGLDLTIGSPIKN